MISSQLKFCQISITQKEYEMNKNGWQFWNQQNKICWKQKHLLWLVLIYSLKYSYLIQIICNDIFQVTIIINKNNHLLGHSYKVSSIPIKDQKMTNSNNLPWMEPWLAFALRARE